MRFNDYANAISLARSPKRGKRERLGVAAWHPYYAGYSEAFVEDALRPLVSQSGRLTVLDPWNGSGTTSLVGQRMGLQVIGTEINPVMVIFAKAKCLSLIGNEDAVREVVDRVISLALEQLERPESLALGDLKDWVPDETLKVLVALRDSILNPTFGSAHQETAPLDLSRVCLRPFYSPLKALLLAALFRVLRKVGGFGAGSNPTWVVKDSSKQPTPMNEVIESFRQNVDQMISDLRENRETNTIHPEVQVFEGNSRALPLQNNSVDAVITSPPYCTRIDYAVSTKPELLLLGLREALEFDQVRRSTMGAPVITGENIGISNAWGKTCQKVLVQIEKHPAKASRSYYLPTFLQYFRDAEQSVREILRVLKPGGFGAVVVQSSYFKEIEIPLGRIYVELVKKKGHFAKIARREVVRQHMAHVNTESSKYKADKVFYEDVVVVSKLKLGTSRTAATQPRRYSSSNQWRENPT